MKIIADLQLHSKYSRAVSPKMILPEIAKWAMIKRINLMATGDWTHPLWFREIKSNLVEKSDGLYGLKDEVPKSLGIHQEVNQPLFLLSGEISSIYSQGGKVRRIHNLIFAPSIEVVEKINNELKNRGANLMSDGRPIVGLTSQEICEVVFTLDKDCLIIPAHCWTPWFSLYGSKSGFDSIDECFGKYAQNVYAVETGLSSDPVMNWRIKELDNRSLISCSDAHSGPKLGREATAFEINRESFTFKDIANAIKKKGLEAKIAYTIEFYPEEGKYHYTGHRLCNIRQSPQETVKKGMICPVCGRPLTIGVEHRVEQLAGRSIDELEVRRKGIYFVSNKFPDKVPYVKIVPLMEIIAEAIESPVNSDKVLTLYLKLCEELGGEFGVLLKADLSSITRVGGERVAQAIHRVRTGNIVVEPGYDGVFGIVKIWPDEKTESTIQDKKEQLDLFS